MHKNITVLFPRTNNQIITKKISHHTKVPLCDFSRQLVRA